MPSLHDDGRSVTLDLHGATVNEAVDLTKRAAREAARRGRSALKLIHGSSTSRRRFRNRTIKHAVHDLLDGGGLGGLVTSTFHTENYVTCSLDITAGTRDPAPIRLLDIVR